MSLRHQFFHPSAGMRRGISQQKLLIIIAVGAGVCLFGCMACALLIGILLPAVGAARRTANQMKNSSQMRGVHQSMVIFAQNNNAYLPGLDDHGQLLAPNDKAFSAFRSNTFSGASMSARYFILANGSYITHDFLVNPQDGAPQVYAQSDMPTPDQFSYSLLRIGTSATGTNITPHESRVTEWKDNANSQALLIADRNTAMAPTSDQVRSVWSTASGIGADWKGTVLWGDNHAEFLNATNARMGALSLNTKYGKTVNSDDFLFNEAGTPGKDAEASAMFGYTTDNH